MIKIINYLVVNASKFIELKKIELISSQEKKDINHQFFFQLLILVHAMLMANGVVVQNGINAKKSKISSMVALFHQIVFT